MKNKRTAIFIRGARKQMRLTQQQLADRVGARRYNIAKYETGSTAPPGGIILNIYRLLEDSLTTVA